MLFKGQGFGHNVCASFADAVIDWVSSETRDPFLIHLLETAGLRCLREKASDSSHI